MQIKPYHLCFETLANELRIKIIELLSEGPMGVNEIAKKLRVERSRVSHSLFILKGCCVVSVEKHGRRKMYSLKDKTYLDSINPSDSILKIIDTHIDKFCDTCFKLK